jgi:hypothetical protein
VPDARAAATIDPVAGARPPPLPDGRAAAGVAPGVRPPPDPRIAATAEPGPVARPPRIPGARPAPSDPPPGAADLDQTETAPRSRIEQRDLEQARPRAAANATVERASHDPHPAPSAMTETSEPTRRDVNRAARRSAPQASQSPSHAFDEIPELAAGSVAANQPGSRGLAAPAVEPSAREADPDDSRRKHQSTGVMLVAPAGYPPAPSARAPSHLAGWIFVVLVIAAATAAVIADLLEVTLEL